MTVKTLWVVPDLDDWRVEDAATHIAEGVFDARDDAVAWACRVAARRGPAQVLVQTYDGQIVERHDFPARMRTPVRGARPELAVAS